MQEEIIDPKRPIIDPHHHMWRTRSQQQCLLEDLWADTESGHNVVKTVFIECRSEYRVDGPEHLRPVGETEFMGNFPRSGNRPARRYAIDCFGPHRCMFERNFPADKLSLSYHVYWNAMKKIASGFSESEKDMLFSGTASRVYKL